MTVLDHALDCISYGVSFRLCAESDALLEKMRLCVPYGTEISARSDASSSGKTTQFSLENAGSSASCRLLVDDEVAGEDATLEPLLEQLTRDLMVHVADHAADRVFVHAGVVGWQGRALVLPGTSFAGKTTLVAELVRAGAIYYSDEYAVLDYDGQVHPYARDLQMRDTGGVEQKPMSIAQLAGSAGDVALPVTRVVFAQYVAGGRWNPQQVSAGMAVLEMMRHAIPVQRTPARVMATLAKMMETATAVRSERGEAGATARLLLASMSSESPS